jgi:hypothetical protein
MKLNPSTTRPAGNPVQSAADIQRLLAAELRLPSRLGYTMLLLASLAGVGVAAALLVTEPALPARTRIAFALMIAIGLSWAVFATWVLARRHVMLAGHHVVAAHMAVAFTTLFTLGASISAVVAGRRDTASAIAAVGLTMLIVALTQLVRARRRVVTLSQRRAALERQLAERTGRAP